MIVHNKSTSILRKVKCMRNRLRRYCNRYITFVQKVYNCWSQNCNGREDRGRKAGLGHRRNLYHPLSSWRMSWISKVFSIKTRLPGGSPRESYQGELYDDPTIFDPLNWISIFKLFLYWLEFHLNQSEISYTWKMWFAVEKRSHLCRVDFRLEEGVPKQVDFGGSGTDRRFITHRYQNA